MSLQTISGYINTVDRNVIGFQFPRTSHFRAAEKRQNVKCTGPITGYCVSVIKKLSWIFEKYITREYGINNIHGKELRIAMQQYERGLTDSFKTVLLMAVISF